MQFLTTIFVEKLIQEIMKHGATPLTQLRVVHALICLLNNILSITVNTPIPEVRYDYCDIDSRCDMCGTVTQAPGYKYDIFDVVADRVSSFSPASNLQGVPKMFGGRQVKNGEVPWQVNLLYPAVSNRHPIGWI